jgi:hypothetical protein
MGEEIQWVTFVPGLIGGKRGRGRGEAAMLERKGTRPRTQEEHFRSSAVA